MNLTPKPVPKSMLESKWNISIFVLLCLYAVCTLIAMAFMNVSFFALLALSLGMLLLSKSKINFNFFELPDFKNYVIYGLILTFVCMLSLVVAKFDPLSYAGHAPEITWHGILKIWYLACPLVLLTSFIQAGGTQEKLMTLVKPWFIMTLFLSVYAVIQFKTGWPWYRDIPTNPGYFHADLFFGHHLSTASILIFPTFVALSLMAGHYSRTKKIRFFELFVSLAGILILFLSYARTAWLAIPLGLVLVSFHSLKPKAILASLVSIVLLLGLISQSSFVKLRTQNTMGINERGEIWLVNIDFFKHRPLTGIGWLKTQEMSEFYYRETDPLHYTAHLWGHAHSNFFEMLGGTGALGLLAFFAWSFFTLRMAVRTARLARQQNAPELSDLSWGLFTALILLHFNGLTNVTFWEGKVMHSQMLAVATLLMIQHVLKGRGHLLA